MSVSMIVVIGRKDEAMLLAPAAIREYRGQNFVIVLDGIGAEELKSTRLG